MEAMEGLVMVNQGRLLAPCRSMASSCYKKGLILELEVSRHFTLSLALPGLKLCQEVAT